MTAVNPEIGTRELICAECGQNSIPAPPHATAETRFTCRVCVERLTQEANAKDAKYMRAWLLRNLTRQRYTEEFANR